MIYLDSAATTKPKKEVIEAVMPYLNYNWFNPSSLYAKGQIIKGEINLARYTIAESIGAAENEIYFTSGATESNNWVIRGFDDNYRFIDMPNIVISPIEHKSIMMAVENPALRSNIHICKVNNEGLIDLDSLESILKSIQHTQILVSIIMANNEIGTIQDIKKISALVHKYDGIFHTDATQAFGHIPIDVKDLGIDLLSASGQKLGGIKGCGFLYIKQGINIRPLIYGSQENGLRGGTENVIGIIALKKAVELSDLNNTKIKDVRDYLINRLKTEFDCRINGTLDYRLPNNVSVTFNENVTGESLIYLLDMSDIYISAGSACNSQTQEPSYVLQAVGLYDEEINKTIRISLPDDITVSQIDKFIAELKSQIKLLTNKQF